MKLKTAFICNGCGWQSQKWLGKCPNCSAWNSFSEEIKNIPTRTKVKGIALRPSRLEHDKSGQIRINTCIEEFDRVLGGGLVKGAIILLSGEPGIGKSTLTLQICGKLAQFGQKTLYISGEESLNQIAARASRLGINEEKLEFIGENLLENIIATIETVKPDCVILDSIHLVYADTIPSVAGSINQIRFCAEALMNFAKKTATPVIIIGHVTKDGTLAGPRVLEHLVDTVLFLEGERWQNFRVLRGLKNRFGPTHEIGIFEMTENGLQGVKNASQIFLEGHKKNRFGSAITATMEGTRPLLVEVQALVNTTVFGYPKRAGSGFDLNRLQLLAAVIQKHLKLNLGNQDIYVNVVGGFTMRDPATDLAVAMAIISSFKKEPLITNAIYLGEIGLAGEVRPVIQLEKRLQEAKRIGFQRVVTGPVSKKIFAEKLEVIMVEDLQQAMESIKNMAT